MPWPVYSGYARHEADRVDRVVDVHLQRVGRKLRDEHVLVEAAQHVRALQHGELRLLDLVVPPARFRQLLLRHLKGVAQKRVVLFQVIRRQVTDSVFALVRFLLHNLAFP